MAESGLTAEQILNSETYVALVTLTSTRDYKRIAEELEKHDVRLDLAPFGDGKGEMAARAIHTLDLVIKQTAKRWKLFRRLVGVHRYLMALYLITLLFVSLLVAISNHYQPFLSSSLVWWLVLGNALGLMGLGAIVQVDKNTLLESEKVERLNQKKMDLISALKHVQSPALTSNEGPSRVPIRDEKGEMTLIRHVSAKAK